MTQSYTIRVKSFPLDKVFSGVINHTTQTHVKGTDGNFHPIKPRMILTLADGSRSIVSRIGERDWSIGADYEKFLGEQNNGVQNPD